MSVEKDIEVLDLLFLILFHLDIYLLVWHCYHSGQTLSSLHNPVKFIYECKLRLVRQAS